MARQAVHILLSEAEGVVVIEALMKAAQDAMNKALAREDLGWNSDHQHNEAELLRRVASIVNDAIL